MLNKNQLHDFQQGGFSPLLSCRTAKFGKGLKPLVEGRCNCGVNHA
jgi:hypothetical protein